MHNVRKYAAIPALILFTSLLLGNNGHWPIEFTQRLQLFHLFALLAFILLVIADDMRRGKIELGEITLHRDRRPLAFYSGLVLYAGFAVLALVMVARSLYAEISPILNCQHITHEDCATVLPKQ